MSKENTQPTIGIVTQPAGDAGGYGAFGDAYVCAGYVKWPQAAGVQTVVIPWDAPRETIDRLLSSVNGVLLPGGPQTVLHAKPYSCLKHSRSAILAMQYLANFLAKELRKNHQSISEADLNTYGFNNLVPTYTEYVDGGPIFEQAYFFGPKSPNF